MGGFAPVLPGPQIPGQPISDCPACSPMPATLPASGSVFSLPFEFLGNWEPGPLDGTIGGIVFSLAVVFPANFAFLDPIPASVGTCQAPPASAPFLVNILQNFSRQRSAPAQISALGALDLRHGHRCAARLHGGRQDDLRGSPLPPIRPWPISSGPWSGSMPDGHKSCRRLQPRILPHRAAGALSVRADRRGRNTGRGAIREGPVPGQCAHQGLGGHPACTSGPRKRASCSCSRSSIAICSAAAPPITRPGRSAMR